MDYNADSIRILTDEEVEERFGFARAGALAKTYPWVPRECIERMLAAAQMSGTDEALIIRRYCEGDASVTIPQEMRECYQELVHDRQCRR